jgi:hypothetical protein
VDAQLLSLVREVIYTGLVVVLPLLLRPLSAWLTTRVKDERWRGASEKLERLAADAVGEVEQTFVRPLKASAGKGGKCWCEDCMPEARRRAEAIVLRHLGARGAAETAARLDVSQELLEQRIRSLIEAVIAKRRG